MKPPQEESARAVVVALTANVVIAGGKLFAFVMTRSTAMLAEAIHSLADTSDQALLLLGRRRSRRPPSPQHPFGYGQEAYFWGFVVAVVLFAVGSLFSLLEGYEKLRHPHHVGSVAWAVGVLLFAMVCEGAGLVTAARAARASGAGSWLRYVRTTRAPANAIVLLEDSAAEIGLVAALTGVVLTAVTGDSRYDAGATLFIGVVLAIVAGILAVEMRSLLIGESASPVDVAAIRAAVTGAGVELSELKTMQLGPHEILVAGSVEVAPDIPVGEATALLTTLEDIVHDAVPAATRVYLRATSA